jgi:1-phosphatidylinositol phosphodiesterase
LLSDTAQLEDVLWGLYHFLDAHSTETIIASLKVDYGDVNDITLQKTLHDQFTTAPTRDYWVQSEDVSIPLRFSVKWTEAFVK